MGALTKDCAGRKLPPDMNMGWDIHTTYVAGLTSGISE